MTRRTPVTAALALGGLVLVAGVVVARLAGVPVGVLTRDATTSAGLPPYTGAISAFTVMVWFAAGTMSGLVAWIDAHHRRRLAPFACLLLALSADDALLLHEVVGPHLGIDERLIYGLYGIGALCVAYLMLGQEPAVSFAFWSGAALLAVSSVVDVAFVGLYLLEDGAKLLGVLVWSTVPVLAASTLRPVGRHLPSTELPTTPGGVGAWRPGRMRPGDDVDDGGCVTGAEHPGRPRAARTPSAVDGVAAGVLVTMRRATGTHPGGVSTRDDGPFPGLRSLGIDAP